jgi:Cu/Ag efflux protein CusF
MRSNLLTAALVAALSMSTAAFASETSNETTTDGTIKSLDLAAHQVVFEDGTVYMLPENFQDPGLKVGERISVAWTMQNGMHEITSVKILN